MQGATAKRTNSDLAVVATSSGENWNFTFWAVSQRRGNISFTARIDDPGAKWTPFHDVRSRDLRSFTYGPTPRPTRFVPKKVLKVLHAYFDEDEVLDFGRLLENGLELGQEVVGGDDVSHFGLVDAESDGVVAQVGVQGDQGEVLLEAAQGTGQPLGFGLGKDAHVGLGGQAQLPQAPPEVGRHGVHLNVRLPPVQQDQKDIRKSDQ